MVQVPKGWRGERALGGLTWGPAVALSWFVAVTVIKARVLGTLRAITVLMTQTGLFN